jgi:hypothetical protein
LSWPFLPHTPGPISKEISIEKLSEEPFILREMGSGTLKILEDYLSGQ